MGRTTPIKFISSNIGCVFDSCAKMYKHKTALKICIMLPLLQSGDLEHVRISYGFV